MIRQRLAFAIGLTLITGYAFTELKWSACENLKLQAVALGTGSQVHTADAAKDCVEVHEINPKYVSGRLVTNHNSLVFITAMFNILSPRRILPEVDADYNISMTKVDLAGSSADEVARCGKYVYDFRIILSSHISTAFRVKILVKTYMRTAITKSYYPPMLWFTYSKLGNHSIYRRFARVALQSWKTVQTVRGMIPVHVHINGYDAKLDRIFRAFGGVTLNATLPRNWTESLSSLSGYMACLGKVRIFEHAEAARPLLAAIPAAKYYDTEYAMWSDLDIVFLASFGMEELPRPGVIAWGSQFKKGRFFENTGVVVVNLKTFKLAIAERILKNFIKIKGACEQDALNKYFKQDLLDKDLDDQDILALPDEYNYKCYWGFYIFMARSQEPLLPGLLTATADELSPSEKEPPSDALRDRGGQQIAEGLGSMTLSGAWASRPHSKAEVDLEGRAAMEVERQALKARFEREALCQGRSRQRRLWRQVLAWDGSWQKTEVYEEAELPDLPGGEAEGSGGRAAGLAASARGPCGEADGSGGPISLRSRRWTWVPPSVISEERQGRWCTTSTRNSTAWTWGTAGGSCPSTLCWSTWRHVITPSRHATRTPASGAAAGRRISMLASDHCGARGSDGTFTCPCQCLFCLVPTMGVHKCLLVVDDSHNIPGIRVSACLRRLQCHSPLCSPVLHETQAARAQNGLNPSIPCPSLHAGERLQPNAQTSWLSCCESERGMFVVSHRTAFRGSVCKPGSGAQALTPTSCKRQSQISTR
ncbi:unnamed protein product [Symbiodinium sp. CCMP2592]|nr:unnamed protein product [Symbiodinium sp. CCMP2592]